jgi:sec-independent protein translocase protein TatA
MLPSVGPTELIILLTIILLLFGAKRIPELAKGLGTGLREFKKATSGEVEKDGEKDELREKDKGEVLTGKADKQDEDGARPQDEAPRAEERPKERAEHPNGGVQRAEQQR